MTFREDTNLAMAPLAQSLFSRPREKRPPGGTAGTPWWLGCSCHPMQLALQLARPSRPNSVHKCPKTAPRGRFGQSVYTPDFPVPVRNGPIVYTNAPIWRGEARSSHLCTLLRSQGHPQPKPTAQQCTQTPQTAPKGRFSQSVYTPALPQLHA